MIGQGGEAGAEGNGRVPGLLECNGSKVYLGAQPTGFGTKGSKTPSSGLPDAFRAPATGPQEWPDQRPNICASIRSTPEFGPRYGSL